jgi:multidrug resistance efflux pump
VLAFYRQNEVRYVEPGDEAEIFVKQYPGRIIKCKVDSILWATAQGQMPLSGNLPNTCANRRTRATHRRASRGR